MIQAVTTAQRLNWKGWGVGIMGAIITGLSSVMVTWSASSLAGLTPHQAKIMIITVTSGAILTSLGKYLQMNPVPPPENLQPPGA